MSLNLYDLLDVERTASAAEIRAAWKAAIADLDPSDRRFRAHNQAAEVLLDPERRAAYDAELAEAEAETEPATEAEVDEPVAPAAERSPEPPPVVDDAAGTASERPARRVVPAWVLILVGCLAVAAAVAAAYAWSRPHETLSGDGAPLISVNSGPEAAAREAQTAAEKAIVPVLSYDAATLDDDQAKAQAYLTSDYRKDYDSLFEVIRQNAPAAQTVVSAEVVASGLVRAGEDRVEVLLFVDRPTTNKQQPQPVVYRDQVRVTMQRVGDDWLIDNMVTSPAAQ